MKHRRACVYVTKCLLITAYETETTLYITQSHATLYLLGRLMSTVYNVRTARPREGLRHFERIKIRPFPAQK